MITPQTVLVRLEQGVRAVARLGREHVALEAFDLFFAEGKQEHLSVAIPRLPNPVDWRPHVAAMQAAFARRGRRPHLEYFAELHPTLAQALEAAGLRCKMRAPVMVLDMAQFSEALPAEGPEQALVYRSLEPGDDPFLRSVLWQQQAAYGMPADDSAFDWLPLLRRGLREGSVMGAALTREGQPLAGAMIQIGDGVGELAGVWTAAPYRQQGLAYALCRRLLADYKAAGYALCWLSAAEGAQRLYEKLGFETVGMQLNYDQVLLTKAMRLDVKRQK